MSDPHVRDHLSAYLDDMLTAAEKSLVENHLSHCEECRQILGDLKNMVAWMKTVPAPKTQSALETRLLARLKEKKSKNSFLFSWRPISGGLATAMAAIFVIMIVHNRPQRIPMEKLSDMKDQSFIRQKSNLEKERPADLMLNEGKASQFKKLEAASPREELKEERKRISKEVYVGSKDIAALAPQGVQPANKNKANFKADNTIASDVLDQVAQLNQPVDVSPKMRRQRNMDIEAPRSASKPMNVEEVDLNYSQSKQLIIKSKEEWNSAANRLGLEALDAQYSSMDFSKQMIAVVFIEKQAAPHQRLQIISEEFRKTPKGQTLFIKFSLSPIPPAELAAATTPHNYDLKPIPVFLGPVEFELVN